MLSVFPIPAFTDNYIWCIHNGVDAIVVDPGDARPVKKYLLENNLTLKGILITHHHADHIGGLKHLVTAELPVYGPVSNRIPFITHAVEDGDKIQLDFKGSNATSIEFSVMHVPGHTTEHIAYYSQGTEPEGKTTPGKLFCGDTMFSVGCGRLFEGTPQQMHRVFQRYRALPGNTKVYCTHEYTSANLSFAEFLTPENPDLVSYREWVNEQRQQNKPTLPSNIALEIKVNPYMRTSEAEMMAALLEKSGQSPQNDVEAFAAIRRLKDNF